MKGLTIRNISKIFSKEERDTTAAIQDVSFDVQDREFLCILGPSGCGKTTLLRMIAGLDTVTSGTIELDDEIITGPSPKMAMIFQEYSLYPWRTVLDNIGLGLELRGVNKEDIRKISREYLELVGLEGFEDRYPHELSGGMRQRVAVARALAIDPEVLLMDEPFGALDAQTRNMMQLELLEIWEKTRKTIIFVTHSVDEAVFLADRIIMLSARPGRICEIIPLTLKRPRDRTGPEFAGVRRYILGEMQKCLLSHKVY